MGAREKKAERWRETTGCSASLLLPFFFLSLSCLQPLSLTDLVLSFLSILQLNAMAQDRSKDSLILFLHIFFKRDFFSLLQILLEKKTILSWN
jgi:hypothetical protein